MESMPRPDANFWARVTKLDDGCWVWTGSTRKGYGRVGRGSAGHQRFYQAHYLPWCEANGPVPDGLELDHRCHDPKVCAGGECQHRRCVNPDHVRAISHADNVRAAIKDRCPTGHDYTEANSYLNPNDKGGRACRTCRSSAREGEKARAAERKRLGLGPGRPGRPRIHM